MLFHEVKCIYGMYVSMGISMSQDNNGFNLVTVSEQGHILMSNSAHTCMLFHKVNCICGMYVSMGIGMAHDNKGFNMVLHQNKPMSY